MYLDPEGDEVPSTKLRWQPFVGMTAYLAANVLEAASGWCRAVAQEFFSAANHDEEQEAFQRRAALEIESLVSGSLPPAPEYVDDDEWDEDED